MHPVQHRTHGIPQAPDSWVLAFYLNTAQCVEPLSGHVQDAVLWISSWSWTRQSSRMQWHLHAWLKAVPCLIFVAKGEKSESLSSQPRARTRSASKATDARRSGPALNVLVMTWKLSRHDGDAPPVQLHSTRTTGDSMKAVGNGVEGMYGHAGGFKHHGIGCKKPKSAGCVPLERKYDNRTVKAECGR
jgi:hypothetical protein